MQLKQLLENDDAVSPVIGVILMVAITVILAAVIATFVLGLGEQVSSTAPQASFSFEYSQTEDQGSGDINGYLSVTHDGGDSVKTTELFVRGQNGSNADSPTNWNSDWDTFVNDPGSTNSPISGSAALNANFAGSASGQIGSQTAVVSGDFIEFPVGSDGEINVVYTAQQGDTSATLGKWEGPDV